MADRRLRAVVRAGVIAAAVPGLVLAGAAAAHAAETFTNADLPGKVVLRSGESASVQLTTPEGFVCTSWQVRKVGQKRANVMVAGPASLEGCTNATVLTYTVSVPADYARKANVVVKFRAWNADGTEREVETLVVKVNPSAAPQTGKPAGKPGR